MGGHQQPGPKDARGEATPRAGGGRRGEQSNFTTIFIKYILFSATAKIN